MADEESIRRVLQGETEAFAAVVHAHYASCLSFARGMLGGREAAEDAVQETFLRAFRALPRYDHRDRFRAWLFRILINRCRTVLEKDRRSRRVPIEELPANAAPAVRPVDPALRAAAREALGRLAPEPREAFLLRHVAGMSYEEISTATGLGISALKMRVARAKEQLRREFERGSSRPPAG